MKCRMKVTWIRNVGMDGELFPKLGNTKTIITEIKTDRSYDKHLKVRLLKPLHFKACWGERARKIQWLAATWFKEFNV